MSTAVAIRRPAAKKVPFVAQIEELSASLGIYHVESRTSPGVMHLVNLQAGTCTCEAAVQWGKTDCSHRTLARGYRARALRSALLQLQAEYGEGLFHQVMDQVAS